MKRLCKIITWILIPAFLCQGVVWTAPLAPSPQPLSIFIPEQYGRIEKTNRQTGEQANGQTVVLIKDAHCNYEAQTNIAKILDILIRDYKIDLVCIEGASGLVDPSKIAVNNDNANARKKVTDKYLKTGLLTAGEALSIDRGTEPGFTIWGVEDLKLYLKDYQAFRQTIETNSETGHFVRLLSRLIAQLKEKLYPEKLLKFDSEINKYEINEIPLTNFIKFLTLIKPIDDKEYPQLALVLESIRLEEKIYFEKVEKERSTLIKHLENNLTKEDLQDLVKSSLLFKLGKVSQLDYYSYIEEYFAVFRDSIPESLENLERYFGLVKLQTQIDEKVLFVELEKFHESIYTDLIPTQEAKKLHELDKDIKILTKILNLGSTKEDFLYYKANRHKFTTEGLTQFVIIQAPLNNIELPPELKDPAFLEKVKTAFLPSEEFYNLALGRDHTISENLIKTMARYKKENAVLIVGGFHTEGIKNKLIEKGVLPIVITPSITKPQENSQELYLARMMDERIKPEIILAKLGQENLSPVPATSDMGIEQGLPEPIIKALRELMTLLPGVQIPIDLKGLLELYQDEETPDAVRRLIEEVVADYNTKVTPDEAIVLPRQATSPKPWRFAFPRRPIIPSELTFCPWDEIEKGLEATNWYWRRLDDNTKKKIKERIENLRWLVKYLLEETDYGREGRIQAINVKGSYIWGPDKMPDYRPDEYRPHDTDILVIVKGEGKKEVEHLRPEKDKTYSALLRKIQWRSRQLDITIVGDSELDNLNRKHEEDTELNRNELIVQDRMVSARCSGITIAGWDYAQDIPPSDLILDKALDLIEAIGIEFSEYQRNRDNVEELLRQRDKYVRRFGHFYSEGDSTNLGTILREYRGKGYERGKKGKTDLERAIEFKEEHNTEIRHAILSAVRVLKRIVEVSVIIKFLNLPIHYPEDYPAELQLDNIETTLNELLQKGVDEDILGYITEDIVEAIQSALREGIRRNRPRTSHMESINVPEEYRSKELERHGVRGIEAIVNVLQTKDKPLGRVTAKMDVELLDSLGMSEGEFLALLSRALAQARKYAGEDAKELLPELFISLLTKSPHIAEDCTGNGFIGIPAYAVKIYHKLKQNPKRFGEKSADNFILFILEHELIHEITGQGREIEPKLTQRDAERFVSLFGEKTDIILKLLDTSNEFSKWVEFYRYRDSTTRSNDVLNRTKYEEDLVDALKEGKTTVQVAHLKIQNFKGEFNDRGKSIDLGYLIGNLALPIIGSLLQRYLDRELEKNEEYVAKAIVYNQGPAYYIIFQGIVNPAIVNKILGELLEKGSRFRRMVILAIRHKLRKILSLYKYKKLADFTADNFNIYGGISELQRAGKKELEEAKAVADRLDIQAIEIAKYAQLTINDAMRQRYIEILARATSILQDGKIEEKGHEIDERFTELLEAVRNIPESNIEQFDPTKRERVKVSKAYVLNREYTSFHMPMEVGYNPKETSDVLFKKYEEALKAKDTEEVKRIQERINEKATEYRSEYIPGIPIYYGLQRFRDTINRIIKMKPRSNLRLTFRVGGDEYGCIIWDAESRVLRILKIDGNNIRATTSQWGREIGDKVIDEQLRIVHETEDVSKIPEEMLKFFDDMGERALPLSPKLYRELRERLSPDHFNDKGQLKKIPDVTVSLTMGRKKPKTYIFPSRPMVSIGEVVIDTKLIQKAVNDKLILSEDAWDRDYSEIQGRADRAVFKAKDRLKRYQAKHNGQIDPTLAPTLAYIIASEFKGTEAEIKSFREHISHVDSEIAGFIVRSAELREAAEKIAGRLENIEAPEVLEAIHRGLDGKEKINIMELLKAAQQKGISPKDIFELAAEIGKSLDTLVERGDRVIAAILKIVVERAERAEVEEKPILELELLQPDLLAGRIISEENPTYASFLFELLISQIGDSPKEVKAQLERVVSELRRKDPEDKNPNIRALIRRAERYLPLDYKLEFDIPGNIPLISSERKIDNITDDLTNRLERNIYYKTASAEMKEKIMRRITQLGDVVRFIREKLQGEHIVNISVFGSYLFGHEDIPPSDLDIVVVVKGNRFEPMKFQFDTSHMERRFNEVGIKIIGEDNLTKGVIPEGVLEGGLTHSAEIVVATDIFSSYWRNVVLWGSDFQGIETDFGNYRSVIAELLQNTYKRLYPDDRSKEDDATRLRKVVSRLYNASVFMKSLMPELDININKFFEKYFLSTTQEELEELYRDIVVLFKEKFIKTKPTQEPPGWPVLQIPEAMRAEHYSDTLELTDEQREALKKAQKTRKTPEGYTQITVAGRQFYVQSNILAAIREDAFWAILASALAHEDLKDLPTDRPFLIASQDRSPRLFEDYERKGFIVINEAFFSLHKEISANPALGTFIADSLLEMGLIQELRHGATERDAIWLVKRIQKGEGVIALLDILEEKGVLEKGGEFSNTAVRFMRVPEELGAKIKRIRRKWLTVLTTNRQRLKRFREEELDVPALLEGIAASIEKASRNLETFTRLEEELSRTDNPLSILKGLAPIDPQLADTVRDINKAEPDISLDPDIVYPAETDSPIWEIFEMSPKDTDGFFGTVLVKGKRAPVIVVKRELEEKRFVKTLIHEAWHAKGKVRDNASLPGLLRNILNEGINERLTVRTLARYDGLKGEITEAEAFHATLRREGMVGYRSESDVAEALVSEMGINALRRFYATGDTSILESALGERWTIIMNLTNRLRESSSIINEEILSSLIFGVLSDRDFNHTKFEAVLKIMRYIEEIVFDEEMFNTLTSTALLRFLDWYLIQNYEEVLDRELTSGWDINDLRTNLAESYREYTRRSSAAAQMESMQIPEMMRAEHYSEGTGFTDKEIKSLTEEAQRQAVDKKDGDIIMLDVKGRMIAFRILVIDGRQFFVEDKTLNIIGLEVFRARLSSALAQEDLKDLPTDRPFLITSLSRSPRLFEDHVGNGFIGINEAFLEMYEEATDDERGYLEILLQLGLEHELIHELHKAGVEIEAEQRIRDIRRIKEELGVDLSNFITFLFTEGIVDLAFVKDLDKISPLIPKKGLSFRPKALQAGRVRTDILSGTYTLKEGSILVAHRDVPFKVHNLWNCVCLYLYDSETGVYSVSHITISGKPEKGQYYPLLYSETNIRAMVEYMRRFGASGDTSSWKAVLIGGRVDETGKGRENVRAVKTHLLELGIPITREDTGGEHGRDIRFTKDGDLRINYLIPKKPADGAISVYPRDPLTIRMALINRVKSEVTTESRIHMAGTPKIAGDNATIEDIDHVIGESERRKKASYIHKPGEKDPYVSRAVEIIRENMDMILASIRSPKDKRRFRDRLDSFYVKTLEGLDFLAFNDTENYWTIYSIENIIYIPEKLYYKVRESPEALAALIADGLIDSIVGVHSRHSDNLIRILDPEGILASKINEMAIANSRKADELASTIKEMVKDNHIWEAVKKLWDELEGHRLSPSALPLVLERVLAEDKPEDKIKTENFNRFAFVLSGTRIIRDTLHILIRNDKLRLEPTQFLRLRAIVAVIRSSNFSTFHQWDDKLWRIKRLISNEKLEEAVSETNGFLSSINNPREERRFIEMILFGLCDEDFKDRKFNNITYGVLAIQRLKEIYKPAEYVELVIQVISKREDVQLDQIKEALKMLARLGEYAEEEEPEILTKVYKPWFILSGLNEALAREYLRHDKSEERLPFKASQIELSPYDENMTIGLFRAGYANPNNFKRELATIINKTDFLQRTLGFPISEKDLKAAQIHISHKAITAHTLVFLVHVQINGKESKFILKKTFDFFDMAVLSDIEDLYNRLTAESPAASSILGRTLGEWITPLSMDGRLLAHYRTEKYIEGETQHRFQGPDKERMATVLAIASYYILFKYIANARWFLYDASGSNVMLPLKGDKPTGPARIIDIEARVDLPELPEDFIDDFFITLMENRRFSHNEIILGINLVNKYVNPSTSEFDISAFNSTAVDRLNALEIKLPGPTSLEPPTIIGFDDTFPAGMAPIIERPIAAPAQFAHFEELAVPEDLVYEDGTKARGVLSAEDFRRIKDSIQVPENSVETKLGIPVYMEDSELKDLLRKNLADLLQKLPPEERDKFLTALRANAPPEGLVIAILDQSEHFGENCRGDGFIGINKYLLLKLQKAIQERDQPTIDALSNLLQVILYHELRHEARIYEEEVEKAGISPEDPRFKREVESRQNLRDIEFLDLTAMAILIESGIIRSDSESQFIKTINLVSEITRIMKGYGVELDDNQKENLKKTLIEAYKGNIVVDLVDLVELLAKKMQLERILQFAKEIAEPVNRFLGDKAPEKGSQMIAVVLQTIWRLIPEEKRIEGETPEERLLNTIRTLAEERGMNPEEIKSIFDLFTDKERLNELLTMDPALDKGEVDNNYFELIDQIERLTDIGSGKIMQIFNVKPKRTDGQDIGNTPLGKWARLLMAYNDLWEDTQDLVKVIPNTVKEKRNPAVVVFHIRDFKDMPLVGLKAVQNNLKGSAVELGIRVPANLMDQVKQELDKKWELRENVILLPEDIIKANADPRLKDKHVSFVVKEGEKIPEGVKAFGVEKGSAFHAVFLFGLMYARAETVDEIKLVIASLEGLGMPKEEVDEILREVEEKGLIFFTVRLVRIEETLKEFQNRRLYVEVAA